MSSSSSSSIGFYDTHTSQYQEKTKNYDMQRLYDLFTAHLPEKSKILDAGCGPGRDLLYFKKQGYDVSAFDGSAEMVNLAKQETKIDVALDTFESIDYAPESFHGIWASASLLHVPKEELIPTLNKLKTYLKPNGFLYISFRHGETEVYEPDRYFNDQTEKKLKETLLAFEGMKLLNIETPPEITSPRGSKFVVALLKKQA